MTISPDNTPVSALVGVFLLDAVGDRSEFLRRAALLYDTVTAQSATARTIEVAEVTQADPVRAFWNETKNIYQWDLLPWQFLYDLYKSWMGRNMPNSKPLGRNKFIDQLVELVDAEPSGNWICPDKTLAHRPSQRLTKPEPLIAEYQLTDWANLRAKPDNLDRYCTLPADQIKATYRGLVRSGAVAQEVAA